MFRWNISLVSICVHCLSLHTTEMSLSSPSSFLPIRYLYTPRFPAQVFFSPGGSALALPASPHRKDAPVCTKNTSLQWGISTCIFVHVWEMMILLLHESACMNTSNVQMESIKKQEVLPCSPHHQVLLYLHVPQWAPVKKKKEHSAAAELKCSKMKKNLTKQTEWKTQNIMFSLSKGIFFSWKNSLQSDRKHLKYFLIFEEVIILLIWRS